MTRRWPPCALVAVVLLLVGAGCAGPHRPIKVGMKELPSDVLLADATASAPLAVDPRSRVAPTIIQMTPPFQADALADPGSPSVPRPTVRPITPLSGCPDPDPDASAREAPDTIAGPPAAATYIYVNRGLLDVRLTDGDRATGPYPAESYRTIADVDKRPLAGDRTGFRFSIADDLMLGGRNITRFYVNGSGLHLAGISTVTPHGTQSTFTPADARDGLLMPLPARAGAETTKVLTDMSAGMVPRILEYRATTVGKVRLDACGVALQVWRVKVDGRFHDRAAGTDLTFAATYDVATQLGGLVVADSLEAGCTPFATDPECANTMNGGNVVHLSNRTVANLHVGPVPTVDPPRLSNPHTGVPVVAVAGFAKGATAASCKVDYGDGTPAMVGTLRGSTCSGPPHTYRRGRYALLAIVTDASGATGGASLPIDLPADTYLSDDVAADSRGANRSPSPQDPARRAFDGRSSTVWTSGSEPTAHWAQVTFARTVTVESISIEAVAGSEPADFEIATAEGAAPLQMRKTVTGNSQVRRVVRLDRPVRADRLRLTVTRAQGGTSVALADVGISPGGSAP